MGHPLVLVLALLADRLLPEPRPHPLAAFGRLADTVANRWNPPGRPGGALAGGVGVTLLVAPPTVLVGLLALLPRVGLAVDAVVIWFALGGHSLARHAHAVAAPLARNDLAAARQHTARLVSRDTGDLDASGCANATVESVLENGSDAIVASAFWYLAAGAPGVIAHRLINTLDAMWGYRTPRWRRFGRAAARLDDLMNWLPARLTALGYTLIGNGRAALRAWRRDASAWGSPNAGPVMAAGAGALDLRLGGPARYHRAWRERPWLGDGRRAEAADIGRALRLLDRTVVLGTALALGGWWLA